MPRAKNLPSTAFNYDTGQSLTVHRAAFYVTPPYRIDIAGINDVYQGAKKEWVEVSFAGIKGNYHVKGGKPPNIKI